MEELNAIIRKYDAAYVEQNVGTLDAVNQFALTFYADVAEIYDCLTRIRNIARNPSGFNLNEAPILGLLVKVWKLMKEIARYYELKNGDIISILERPLIEAAVTASFLAQSQPTVVEDYRKCSYKDRLRIIRDMENGSPFFDTESGKRLLASVRNKLDLENLQPTDFQVQKSNRWRLQGKSFKEIFSEVHHADLYTVTYGMMSESIQGSWNDSIDFCLWREDDGTFSAYPFYSEPDVRYLCPMLRFTNPAYRAWFNKIEVYSEDFKQLFDRVDRVNTALFRKFDKLFPG